jgi:hypothetical protein
MEDAVSKQLTVAGNKLALSGFPARTIRLRGVNIPSLSWGAGEYIAESVILSFDAWNCNVIRLPVSPDRWLGKGTYLPGRDNYRRTVDDIIRAAGARGKYVILDCHEYICPTAGTLEFWMDAAETYKNNPAALFGLLNEPYGVSWEVWRNGGNGYIGHQALVDAIRGLGANNILVAGGLDYAYDLRGIAENYRLTDTESGYGIIYDSHIYPMKGNKADWDGKVGCLRGTAPVLIGEFGWDADNPLLAPGGNAIYNAWLPALLDWMDDTRDGYGEPVSWTAWNLHPSSTPKAVSDWTFKPTYFFGQYVKNRLLSYPLTGVLADREYSRPDIKITSSVTPEAKQVIPMDLVLNGLQAMTFTLKDGSGGSSGISGRTYEIGFEEADGELYAKTFTTSGNAAVNLSLSVNELTKTGNGRGNINDGDGFFSGAVTKIYITADGGAPQTMSNIKLITSRNPTLFQSGGNPTNQPEPHPAVPGKPDREPDEPVDSPVNYLIDFDTTALQRRSYDYGGPGGSTLNSGIYPQGYAGNGLRILYNRNAEAEWGGTAYWDFPVSGPGFENARYISFLAKSADSGCRVSVSFLGSGGQLRFSAAEPVWTQYVFKLSELGITEPDLMSGMNIYPETVGERGVIIDNIRISSYWPEYEGERPEGEIFMNTFDNDFFIWSVIYGSKDEPRDTMSVFPVTVDGGNAYEITYSRPAGAKGKAANIAFPPESVPFSAKYFTFDIKAEKGDRLSVNLVDLFGVDAEHKELIFTDDSWRTVQIPINDYNLHGPAMAHNRAAGIRIYNNKENHSGTLLLDNIGFTDVYNGAASTDFRVITDEIILNGRGVVSGNTPIHSAAACFETQNNTETGKEITLVLALYKDNVLIGVTVSENTIIPAGGDIIKVEASLSNTGGVRLNDGYSFARFIFTDFADLTPLY